MRDHVGSFFSEKYEREICFPENWENIRNCIKISFKDIYV